MNTDFEGSVYMSPLRLYLGVVTRHAVRTAWGWLAVVTLVLGGTVISIIADAVRLSMGTLIIDVILLLVGLTLFGGYRAWKSENESLTQLDKELETLKARPQVAGPTLIGSKGGDVHTSGNVGGVVIPGNAGHGGGVAYGPGAVAYGGGGGLPPVSTFERLARHSLGMGYGLEEFITFAGFDPFGPEIDRIGAGGSGGSSDGSVPASDGGPGLSIISGIEAPGPDGYQYRWVSIAHHDGRQSTIRSRRTIDGVLEPPNVQQVSPSRPPHT